MTNARALEPTPIAADRGRLAELEAELAACEAALAARKRILQRLQARYLKDIGGLYAELATLQTAVTEAEIRAGLKPAQPLADPEGDDTDVGSSADDHSGGGCGHPSAPSSDLKRTFRDLAKAIHPDRAPDESARGHRHSLMAEANRAYADRDEDRLRLILQAWEQSPEAVQGDDPEAERLRVQRRSQQIAMRLVAIEAEFTELQRSAIDRLRGRVDEAAAQGWDLFAEMVRQVTREIGRATARLSFLERPSRGQEPSSVPRSCEP